MIVILIGYMGSGKSTIGERLAKSLNYKFTDLDQAIENEEQLSISELFAEKGEVYFRKKERNVLESILTNDSDLVLATGGGTPCFGDNMDFINSFKDVITVYLNTSNVELTKRLFDERLKRPLISHLNTEELLNDFIRKHLFERSYFYNQSEITITTNHKTIDAIIEEIKNNIN